MVEGGVKDVTGRQPMSNTYPKEIVDDDGSLLYDEIEKWYAEKYILSDREDFLKKNNRQYLINSFINGHSY